MGGGYEKLHHAVGHDRFTRIWIAAMIEETEFQLSLFASLPALDEDELEDAEFRAKDRAWAALIEVYEDRKSSDGLNYKLLGDRIGRSRKQVQRWLSSSVNMTLGSIGLLAEGMDADLDIRIYKRVHEHAQVNFAHPSEVAYAWACIGNQAASLTSLVKGPSSFDAVKSANPQMIIAPFKVITEEHESA